MREEKVVEELKVLLKIAELVLIVLLCFHYSIKEILTRAAIVHISLAIMRSRAPISLGPGHFISVLSFSISVRSVLVCLQEMKHSIGPLAKLERS